MEKPLSQLRPPVVVEREDLGRLFDALARRGRRIIGPTIRDRAIVYGELACAEDLPVGWADEQDNGIYRLRKAAGAALFHYVVGPQSLKKYLCPSTVRLWQAHRGENNAVDIVPPTVEAPETALIGVRPCELQALAVQDKVFSEADYVDPGYQARRQNLFIVAVNCTHPAKTCFCVSMNSGPKASTGFDLALTEILAEARHWFLVETGSEPGAQALAEVPNQAAGAAELQAAQEAWAQAARGMGRTLETAGLKDLLYDNDEHARWDEVAERCLTCGNCTMACPTCFCSTVEDFTDLTGHHAERRRQWDSCFTVDFSYIHGGSVRSSAKSRYRQWMTHKLATWIDQFGLCGCVGCGRCLTWCPVGIDITEEARAIRQSPRAGAKT